MTEPIRRDADNHLGYFDRELTGFFDAMAGVARQTVNLVHTALGLSNDVAEDHIGLRDTSTIRINHYTVGDPVPLDQRHGLDDLGPVALGHHTDPGVLTLLIQDDTGGLQALDRSGAWIDVPPRPGTIVVNLGDVMQVWTNDRYRAAVHRVVPMTNTDRYSIPLFFNPAANAVVEPIAQLVDDVQISDFRIPIT